MFVAGFPTGLFAANCYVVATGRGEECVVVDPGQDAAPAVAEIVREHRLKPVAVLLTHGHLDHLWSVLPVCGSYEAVCWVHPADRSLLANPSAGLPGEWAAALLGPGERFAEPSEVRELTDGTTVEVAGLRFRVDHTPGHTPGSVTYHLGSFHDAWSPPTGWSGGWPAEGGSALLFAGDLLFAGSVGRTDLPGGDHPSLLHSLVEKVLPLDDGTVVLPGHGELTTVGRERRTNPYLAGLVTHHAGATRSASVHPRHGHTDGHTDRAHARDQRQTSDQAQKR